MGKLAIALLAFAAGAVVGGLVVKKYVEQHGLGLVLQGAADKYLGKDSAVGKVLLDVGDSLQGVN